MSSVIATSRCDTSVNARSRTGGLMMSLRVTIPAISVPSMTSRYGRLRSSGTNRVSGSSAVTRREPSERQHVIAHQAAERKRRRLFSITGAPSSHAGRAEDMNGKATLGLILNGGQARRMSGADKGLVRLAGRPMLAHVIDRLRPQCAALALNANGGTRRALPVFVFP